MILVSLMLGGLSTAFSAVLMWTNNLFNSMSAGTYILGALFAMFAVRFLIYPFLKGGVGASDPVKRVKSRSKDNE